MVGRAAVLPFGELAQLAAGLLLVIDHLDNPLEQGLVPRLKQQQPARLARVGGPLRRNPEGQHNRIAEHVIADLAKLDSQHGLDLVARAHELLALLGLEPGFQRGQLFQAGEQTRPCEFMKLVPKVFDRQHHRRVRWNKAQHRVDWWWPSVVLPTAGRSSRPREPEHGQ